MKRNILLSDGHIQLNEPGFEPVSVMHIDSIANRSCDIIRIPILEYIKIDNISRLIEQILLKIRPKGYLHITFLNSKLLCKDYLANKISSNDFLKLLQNKNHLLSFDYFTTIIDLEEYSIINYVNDDKYQSHIVISKTSYDTMQ